MRAWEEPADRVLQRVEQHAQFGGIDIVGLQPGPAVTGAADQQRLAVLAGRERDVGFLGAVALARDLERMRQSGLDVGHREPNAEHALNSLV